MTDEEDSMEFEVKPTPFAENLMRNRADELLENEVHGAIKYLWEHRASFPVGSHPRDVYMFSMTALRELKKRLRGYKAKIAALEGGRKDGC